MSKVIPNELRNHVLPFNWDVQRVWKLPATVEIVSMQELDNLFDLPFWSSVPHSGMLFDITPNQVLACPEQYPHQLERIEKADIQFPIDFIYDNNTYFILDGLHRLAKLRQLGVSQVKVRKHDPNVRRIIEV